MVWGLEVRNMRTSVFSMLRLKGWQVINIKSIEHARL